MVIIWFTDKFKHLKKSVEFKDVKISSRFLRELCSFYHVVWPLEYLDGLVKIKFSIREKGTISLLRY